MPSCRKEAAVVPASAARATLSPEKEINRTPIDCLMAIQWLEAQTPNLFILVLCTAISVPFEIKFELKRTLSVAEGEIKIS
jgi:hypothetical protein